MKMACFVFIICTALVHGCASVTSPQPPTVANARAEQSEQAAADLNRLFNDVQQNDCREIGTNLPRGLYYCSGVIIRATSDGDYLPWTHSPASMARGSASFSWFRKDDHPTVLLSGSGFIVRNAVESHRLGLPGFDEGFICLFPKDASTGGNVLHNGCISRFAKPVIHQAHLQPDIPHHNARFAWGSCEDAGITSLEQWMDYTGDMLGDYSTSTQCSWNVDSQNGWRNSLAMQTHYPLFDFYWNELLMATVDDGYSLKDMISAVFLDVSNYDQNIQPARNFQRKLIANNSYAPILRLDLSSDQPFSFHQEDQITEAH
ncbi:hypothetical protein N5D61_07860 [Pseudomonas sp. GD03842]|uniref:hypothetical protein n=1 Tax=Pseudomonas sp. GD03842 TaxID=2975385 RepID=UPI00244CCB97|nr:hypothetical protein [Pseudomonas sp. GD03842]MDH0746254.1 hypothetical protein [Pseudomonas sp. GD03842]